MKSTYDPMEPFAWLIEQLEKGREIAQSGVHTIYDTMMTSKGINLLAQTGIFNDEIREWRRQTTEQKTWAKYKLFFRRYHQEQRRAVATAYKKGYTTTVQNLYGVTPTPPEEHHESIENIQTIMLGMKIHSYSL